MGKGNFAGICVLDNPYQVDGIYDYEVPVELDAEIYPGRFVVVPFGMRNVLRIGLVAERRDRSQYKELKMIRTVCPDCICLDDEMQGLCEFLKTRLLSPTGDAVRAMVPAAAFSRLRELYAISPDYTLGGSDITRPSDTFVYRYLSEHGESPMTALRAGYGLPAESSARRLLARGILTRRVFYDAPREGKPEKLWSLAVSPVAAQVLAGGEEWEKLHLTSAGHKSILAVLAEENAPMTTLDLCSLASVKPPQIKALLQKGLLHCEERVIDRNPYAEVPFAGMTPLELNEDQKAACRTLFALADAPEPRAALLHGVTGSGKTRVMTALIDHLLQQGKGVILLLPEIALTPQSVSIFCARYGSRVAVMHSALSAGERYDAYCRIKRGEADVVIGTRSAVFAPVQSLGAVIIDEEQEHTYKSDQNPKYHAKDVARYRCGYHNALMLLASATPSLESYQKAKEGIYTLIELKKRCGRAVLPTVQVVDMRQEAQAGNNTELSQPLTDALQQTLQKGEQAVLFLNRRGYNRAVICRKCGKPVLCPRCSVAMTYHTRPRSYREGELVCHLCGYRAPAPRVCPEQSCQSVHLSYIGYGTQRMEEELRALFPQARILRMDADTTTSKSAYDKMLGAFRRHEADILLGTQMVTKGHDFPDVTLVGVLMADASLYIDDYRAAERCFSMLTQVIGRAGRADRPGRALIQTNNPDSEIIRLAVAQDYPSMYERELRLRRLLCFPPACDIVLITVSGRSEDDVLRAARRMSEELREQHAKPEFSKISLYPFGPFEAPVYRVDNRYRMRMVIKCRLTKPTVALFHAFLCRFANGIGPKIQTSVDFNPSNL